MKNSKNWEQNVMIGQTISHYKILEKLGEGGMGVVYKAEDTKLKRTVALKFLPLHTLAGEEEKARFEHEAQAAARLDHPNICTVYEINETDGQAFIAMAYVDGQSLQGIMNTSVIPAQGGTKEGVLPSKGELKGGVSAVESRPLPIDKAINYAVQIAEGLQAAHEKGIVHRDIKPANILIAKRGQVRITDFGLAKLAGRTQLTKEGTSMGTVAYMSPEQTQGIEVDHRTDIWALGAVIYEMITGKQPFVGDYEQAVMYSIMNEDPEPPTALRTGVPMELERIINKTLAKNREDRYQHTAEMIVDLKAAQRELQTRKPAAKRPERKRKKKRAYLYGASALLMVSVIIVVMLFQTGNSEAIDSIAVLPLKNLSYDPKQDYFVDGMTEALTMELGKISALRVISRQSVMRYKDTDKLLPEIANELNVSAVVEGSALREGERVRITVKLIKAATDEQLWGQSYERELRNILALHNEVARSIAQEINVKLTSQEEAHLASTRPVDPAVYELYLRGRHLCNTFVEEEWYRGIDQFKQALKHDSSYAPAYAGLARCYSNLALIAYLSPADAFSAAEAAVSKALELDESLGEAHASRGYMKLLFKWDWSGAKRDLQRALELEPNNVGILLYYGHYLTMTNQNDEARKAYDRAMELDPLSPTTALWRAWGAGFITRRYDQSIRQLERILELEPQYTHAHMWLAVNYVKKGMYAEAFAKANEVEAIAPESEDQGFLGVLGWIYGAVGQRDDALRILQQLQGLAPRRWLDPFFVAVIHTGLEDKDNAFQWLRKAYEERSPSLVLFINHPMADNISSDPRFGKLMKDMGFESG